MNATQRRETFRRWHAANPTPRTELEYSTPFELLVAVVLSAQATDKSVNLATRRLFSVADTPEKILALGEAGLADYIKSLGLYRSKARHIVAACRMLIELHGSVVPREREALEALPGVGRKTANVILNTAFGEPAMAVDTHVFRVANRMKLAPGKTVLAVEKALLKVIPAQYLVDAHHWLILHGRYTCVARKPKCETCIVADLCGFPGKTWPPAAACAAPTPAPTAPPAHKTPARRAPKPA